MKKKIAVRVMSIICTVIVCAMAVFSVLLAGLAVRFMVKYQTSVVQQFSMVPNYNLSIYLDDPEYKFNNNEVGDMVFTKKGKYKVGDVVTAKVPGESQEVFKRLVGLPGDKIRIEKTGNGSGATYSLLVNEKVLYSKPYLQTIGTNKAGEEVVLNNSNTYLNYINFFSNANNTNNIVRPDGELVENNPLCYIVINEGECFLLGDNWNNSFDSLAADFGAIDVKNITGRVVYKIGYGQNTFFQTLKLIFKDAFC